MLESLGIGIGLMAGMYIILVFVWQWQWSKTCANNVMVMVQRADGHGDTELAPLESGSITLNDPKTGTGCTWPINELSTLTVPYPGRGGLVPRFLQKSIRLVLVSEDDWEPITNRSVGRKQVGSPYLLHNLLMEKVTAAVITVNKETMDALAGIGRRLTNLPNPRALYIGLGLLGVGLAVAIYLIFQMVESIEVIESALKGVM